MNRIKLCHVIDSANFNPLLYNSIAFSDREKFEYTVISLSPKGKLHEQMRELGVKSLSLDCLSRKNYLPTILKLRRILRKEKFHIVQAHSFEASLVGLIAALLANIPVRIFTGHHSHEVPLYKNKKLTFVDSLLSRRLTTGVLAPSRQMKEIFIESENVPPEKIEVIPHGMDLDEWRLAALTQSGIRSEFGIEDKIIFGAVGRLFWVKDFETLIKAFAKVAEKRNDIALLIVGGGSDEGKLNDLIESLKMEKRIILTGRREDIAAVMSEFDVFVHPALAESFGLVYIEAFALGKPVISTKVGVAAEIIEDRKNGFLVETRNENSLKSALEKMLDIRDEWEKMGENGRKIAAKYSVKLTQKLCDDYYASLVDF